MAKNFLMTQASEPNISMNQKLILNACEIHVKNLSEIIKMDGSDFDRA